MPSGDIWAHLAETVLPDYILNSLILMIGIGILTTILGVSTAWLVTMCDFRFRTFFEWALLLPMAIPAYLLAYIFTDFLDVAGPIQQLIRDLFEVNSRDYWFPDIRSRTGAIIIMSLSFYPYVYLLSRATFLEQPTSYLEAGRNLGYSTLQSFLRISLPMARPGIIAGLALVLMETLNDFGTVEYFGIQTFTTGIYRTWFGLGERTAAAQLSAFLLGFIAILLVIERYSRSKRISQDQKTRFKRIQRFRLKGGRESGSILLCSIPVLFGFGMPLILLIVMFFNYLDLALHPRFFGFALNTLSVGFLTAAVAIVIALLMAYARRLNPTRSVRFMNRLASIGYAIPGSVIAVGVLIPFGAFDNWINDLTQETFNFTAGLIFSGTLFAMIFAYLVRFLAVSYNTVEASMQKITPGMDEAARGLGYSFFSVLRKIHIPMMGSSLLTAILLVVVDVMKELPATLIVRPFNFETLAVQVYRLASDERLGESSGAALAIVVVGLIPVLILSRSIAKTRKSDSD